MTMLREVRFIPIEQERDANAGPDEAYFMDSGVANEFVVGSGSKATEATAFLKDVGSGALQLDDDIAEEDRRFFLVSNSEVLI